jgi:hypothetical protein
MKAEPQRRGPQQDLPPAHNVEAEQAVLAGLLLCVPGGEDALLAETLGALGRGDFYLRRHQLAFDAVEALHREGRRPDLVTVTDWLRGRRQLDDAGGIVYLTELLTATYSPATLPQHLAILKRDAARRTLGELGVLLQRGTSNGQDLEALLALTGCTINTVRTEFDSSTIGREDKKNHCATAAELLNAPPSEAGRWWPFLQPSGVLGPGVVGLLSGYAKSGKTTTTAHGVDAVLRAHPGSRMIWCTEESRSLWRARLLRWRFDWPTVTFVFRSSTPWLTLAAEIHSERPDGVIIDTPRAFLQIADENDASSWRVALDPLLLMARQDDAAVLLLHHLRKSGGDEGLAHAGNHALVAAVDVALELRRDPQASARRVIRAVSRFDETPTSWVLELRDEGLVPLGDPEAIQKADLLARLITTVDDTPRTAAEIAADFDNPKPSVSAVYAGLKELHRQGAVNRTGKGTRGTPYRWVRNTYSSSPTPLRVEEGINSVESREGGAHA